MCSPNYTALNVMSVAVLCGSICNCVSSDAEKIMISSILFLLVCKELCTIYKFHTQKNG